MSEPVERCECGAPLDGHPPVPKVGPFRSWRVGRATKPTSRPGPAIHGIKRRRSSDE